PLFFDELISDMVAEEFIKIAQKNPKNCFTYLPYVRSKNNFSYYGVSHLRLPRPNKLGWKKFQDIGLMSDASHMVTLEVDQTETGLRAEVRTFDLVKTKEIDPSART